MGQRWLFCFERRFVQDYLDDDPEVLLECRPLQKLAADGQLSINQHESFWMGMDTCRDSTELHTLWDRGRAPGNLAGPATTRAGAMNKQLSMRRTQRASRSSGARCSAPTA